MRLEPRKDLESMPDEAVLRYLQPVQKVTLRVLARLCDARAEGQEENRARWLTAKQVWLGGSARTPAGAGNCLAALAGLGLVEKRGHARGEICQRYRLTARGLRIGRMARALDEAELQRRRTWPPEGRSDADHGEGGQTA